MHSLAAEFVFLVVFILDMCLTFSRAGGHPTTYVRHSLQEPSEKAEVTFDNRSVATPSPLVYVLRAL